MRRIQRDTRHEDFIKNLCSAEGGNFREIWRVLMLAASIGAKFDLRVPLVNVDAGRSMPEAYFNNPSWPGFLFLLGIVGNSGSDCLSATPDNEESLITLFEEYANGGLDWLKTRLENAPTSLDGLINAFQEATPVKTVKPKVDNLL